MKRINFLKSFFAGIVISFNGYALKKKIKKQIQRQGPNTIKSSNLVDTGMLKESITSDWKQKMSDEIINNLKQSLVHEIKGLGIIMGHSPEVTIVINENNYKSMSILKER